MKNQASKYALGLTLLAVWGLVGFRVYQKFGPKELNLPPPRYALATTTATPAEPFQLLLDYRDPFSGKSFPPPASPPKTVSNPPKPAAAKPKKPPAPPALPKIVYKGHVALRDGRQAALLRIDNQLVNMGEGERHDAVQLLKIYGDSVKVEFKGQQATVAKVQ